MEQQLKNVNIQIILITVSLKTKKTLHKEGAFTEKTYNVCSDAIRLLKRHKNINQFNIFVFCKEIILRCQWLVI